MTTKRAASMAGAVGACLALVGCAGEPVDERPVVRIVDAAQPSVTNCALLLP